MADTQKKAQQPEMSKEEQIGFHKGSISVLVKEREELIKMAQVVEQIMQMHLKALADLGVDIQQVQNQANPDEKPTPQKRVPIENLI